MKNLKLINALYDLLELAEMGRDNIKAEVKMYPNGFYNEHDIRDSDKKIEKAKKLADEFYN